MHRPGPLDQGGPVESTQIDRAEMPAVDVHRDHAFAPIVCRQLVEIARAAGIAVAVLEPLAFHCPPRRHGNLRGSASSWSYPMRVSIALAISQLRCSKNPTSDLPCHKPPIRWSHAGMDRVSGRRIGRPAKYGAMPRMPDEKHVQVGRVA